MKPPLTATRLDRAITTAAQAFAVPRREITSRCRLAPIARARLALYAALYQACATSYPELGARLGRHYTTVLSGVREAERAAGADPDYAERLARIVAACEAEPPEASHACA
jgi:chromosomal replication initiation ATPase DnaA